MKREFCSASILILIRKVQFNQLFVPRTHIIIGKVEIVIQDKPEIRRLSRVFLFLIKSNKKRETDSTGSLPG